MYKRIIKSNLPKSSFFLFGPRGTGKTTFLKRHFPDAINIDLLQDDIFNKLLANPSGLQLRIPDNFSGWIIIDEVQKIPAILDEVHRLIENNKYKFILTGSNARKLKKRGVNLLAGRAITLFLSPLCSAEIGDDYNFEKALTFGMLPTIWDRKKLDSVEPKSFLASYLRTYLKEEIQQEGLTRNLGNFSRFLETASFSQGEQLNISDIARDSAINRKMAEGFFQILEDLLIAYRIPVFTKRAKRKLANHPKFYFFDTGLYREIRPKGPLDLPELIDGAALETLLFQELKAHITQKNLAYEIFYWRTSAGNEVDFILYGNDGLIAIEIKRKNKITNKDISGLKSFIQDYPMAKCFFLYGGQESLYLHNKKITVLPIKEFIQNISVILS